jgi:hypothetical protein
MLSQVPDTNLLLAPELDDDLEERLDAVGTLGKGGVVAVIISVVVEATVADAVDFYMLYVGGYFVDAQGLHLVVISKLLDHDHPVGNGLPLLVLLAADLNKLPDLFPTQS